MKDQTLSDLVKRYFSAYETKDKKAIEELLSNDFTFSSPHDPRIDMATYFRKCWPFSEKVKAYKIKWPLETGNEGFFSYACETIAGKKFNNAEFFRKEGNRIKEIKVYYGDLPES